MMRCIRKNKSKYSSIVDYTKRGRFRPELNMNKGQLIDNFQLVQKDQFRDFAINYHKFLNKQNKTQSYHHFDCSQQINTLAFAFKLPQLQKSGINYAVQKMIQCGSHKYPIRNITGQMVSRSFNPINTIITNSEYMMFSFQTHCIKDYEHLFEVYFSMLFDAMLRKQDFTDVVRRLVFYRNNAKENLMMVGQMHKQMEGLNCYLQNFIYKEIYKELLGKQKITICPPQQVLKISFSDVIEFYKRVFVPSNCTLISYGDLNPSFVINKFNKLKGQNKIRDRLVDFKSIELKPFKVLQKTVKIKHLESQIPMILSFKINQSISGQQKILLSILSYILFDMPDSPFLIYNQHDKPYPALYGFNQTFFNIGITISTTQTKLDDKIFIDKQKEIRQLLRRLYQQKISDDLIQRTLLHLQGSFFTKQGSKVIESVISHLLNNQDVKSVFNVTDLISRTLRNYRKQNIFENLIKKYIINNQQFIRIYGQKDSDLMDDQQLKRNRQFQALKNSLSKIQIQQIIDFKGQVSLQNPSILPQISVNQIQIFETPQPSIFELKGVPIHHVKSQTDSHIKLLFRFDFTDIDQSDLNLLHTFCQAFPRMGGKSMKDQFYLRLVDKFIDKLQMNFQTQKVDENNMKIYLYLRVQFTQRNSEHGFTVINSLLNQFKHTNYQALSKQIHRESSKKFTDISQNLIQCHGLHLAGSKSPYCQIEDPLFHARSVCSLAEQIMKVVNPKQYLVVIGQKIGHFAKKITKKQRISILIECSEANLQQFQTYLSLVISSLAYTKQTIQTISTIGYSAQTWMKYFPNYDQPVCLEAFSIPFQGNASPAAMVLSKIIDINIKKFNRVGGSFIHKGAMVNFIGGNRKKVIQLEQCYRKIQQLDEAKRNIFQHFAKTQYEQSFKSGVSLMKAKQFKQAVIATQKQEIESLLHQYILSVIQKGESSILTLGQRLQNYQPLLKKGWQIERSIQGTSLKMESLSKKEIDFKGEKFLKLTDC